MNPGRFVTLWFLAFGVLMLLQYALGVALGEIPLGLSVHLLGLVLPGVGVLLVGLDRLRNPAKEE